MAKGTKIANAIVPVIPSMEGSRKTISKDLQSIVGSAADSAGKSGGKTLGGSIGSGLSTMKVAIGNVLGNIITSAVSSASAVVKDTLSDAFNNFADYEQLKGGVEKIFDQANQAQIFEDAKNAYKDLNMSVNEYLESINLVGATFAQTMGDQKGYDTARKGMKAISDYATGTGKNIDELNDKYQLITRATSSYQSIADQFSGILPATSADFLEQAKAAGFLKNEYKKLTDVPVAEYQEAVTNMLEKGVAALGLANNTANESFNTLSGSISMLEKSWQNWITGLGDSEADMSKLSQNLVESLKAALDNIKPVIAQMFIGAFEGALDILDEMGLSGAADFLRGLRDALNSESVKWAFDNIAKTAEVIGESLSKIFGGGETKEFQTAIEMIAQQVGTFALAIRDIWPVLEQIISTVTGVLYNAFAALFDATYADVFWEMLYSIWGLLGDIASTIVGLFASFAPSEDDMFDFLTSVFALIRDIADGLRELWAFLSPIISTIADVAGTVFGALVEVFVALGDAVGVIGEAAGAEMADGLSGLQETFTVDLASTIKEIVGLIKDGLLTAIGWLKDNGPAIGEVLGSIGNTVMAAFDLAATVIGGIVDVISTLIANLVDFFTNDPVGQKIAETVGSITATIGDLIGTIAEWLGWLFGAITEFLTATDEDGTSTFQKIGDFISGVFEGISNVVLGLAETFDGVLTTIKGLFEVVFGLVQGIVTGDFSMMCDGIEDLVKGSAKTIQGVWDTACAVIGGFFDNLGETVTGIFEGILDFISDIPGNIAEMFSNIKLPELKLEGDWNLDPFNFQMPEIKFMAAGGMLNRTTIVGGEAGPELMWPAYDPYFSRYAAGIAKHLDDKSGGDTYFIVDGAEINSTEEMKKNWYDNFLELKRLGVMQSGYAG